MIRAAPSGIRRPSGRILQSPARPATWFTPGSSDGRIWFRSMVPNLPGPALEGGRSRGAHFVDAAEPRWRWRRWAARRGRTCSAPLTPANFWDPLDGNLPDAPAHGVTAERAAGAFMWPPTRVSSFPAFDLKMTSRPGSVRWTSLSTGCGRPPPPMCARIGGSALVAALDGHGVYAAAAPQSPAQSADRKRGRFQLRAAAPGSLLSVIGGW